ncbi:MAG TPA: hypothetical protein VJN50_03185 [Actinomycetota bacterium]|nr:hypothetical protein [Actinomycetota bacterium]
MRWSHLATLALVLAGLTLGGIGAGARPADPPNDAPKGTSCFSGATTFLGGDPFPTPQEAVQHFVDISAEQMAEHEKIYDYETVPVEEATVNESTVEDTVTVVHLGRLTTYTLRETEKGYVVESIEWHHVCPKADA